MTAWISIEVLKFLKFHKSWGSPLEFHQSHARKRKNKDSPKWPTRLNISYLELQLVTILLYNKKEFWNVSFKRELFEVLQKHQSSVINSFIFNYSVWMNWWKHAFNAVASTQRGRWDIFQKRRFQSFISGILRVINLFEEKFFSIHWDNITF